MKIRWFWAKLSFFVVDICILLKWTSFWRPAAASSTEIGQTGESIWHLTNQYPRFNAGVWCVMCIWLHRRSVTFTLLDYCKHHANVEKSACFDEYYLRKIALLLDIHYATFWVSLIWTFFKFQCPKWPIGGHIYYSYTIFCTSTRKLKDHTFTWNTLLEYFLV